MEMRKLVDEKIELPPHIIDLLESCNERCHFIENEALHLLRNTEIAVFNGLRNLSSQECLKILDRIGTKYHSEEDLVEYVVCLAVLTEYVCTAYRNTNLYETFHVALSKSFKQILFDKLYLKWLKVYENENLSSIFETREFKSSFSLLKYSVAQFPASFTYKHKLRDIIRRGEELLTELHQQNSPTDYLKAPGTSLCSASSENKPATIKCSMQFLPVASKIATLDSKLPVKNFAQPACKTLTDINISRSNMYNFKKAIQFPTLLVPQIPRVMMENIESCNVGVGTSANFSELMGREKTKVPIMNVSKPITKTSHAAIPEGKNILSGAEITDFNRGVHSTSSVLKISHVGKKYKLSKSMKAEFINDQFERCSPNTNISKELGGIDLTEPEEMVEPPKKILRNAFDVLMKRKSTA